ncbi:MULTISPECIES: TraB/GumN family protein [unclassified Brevundimonas]|uniref:TraB/GumN family protein n=1 Tax=unclassified Brevundimonas TaxID=2622653 RepID=UPI0025BFFD8C|nr:MULTISPECIES: TraB/GumN family protein [unclassified Brevundimonas]
MFKTARRLLVSAAAVGTLFLAPSVAFAEQAPATVSAIPQAQGQGPAMWVIRDEDSTLYLLGSFHLLRPSTGWSTPQMEQAFASADEIWLELTDADDVAQAQQLMVQHGLSPDRPLSSLLSAEDMAMLDAAAVKMGANAAAFDPMRPWLVSMQLVLVQMVANGYDPNAGVEKVLTARAAALGKPLKGFESLKEQIELMAGMSEEGQVEMLRAGLKDLNETPEEIDKLVQAWSTGNIDYIDQDMVQKMKVQSPEAYDIMLTRRNANWTRQIKTLLEGSGTAFIAVGAAHLAGPDSVQAMLAAEGIQAERLPN